MRKDQDGQMASRSQPCLVIPAYNEGSIIARVVGELRRAGYAAVVVDDGSRDATAEAAHAAGAAVVRHPL
jgi:polyprenyl-phospho-N-acetylgalactosaminyl synthase